MPRAYIRADLRIAASVARHVACYHNMAERVRLLLVGAGAQYDGHTVILCGHGVFPY
ncbi:MAG: hypothetical protein WCQ72_03760 [Eubacteriales bacterium]